MRKIFDGVSGNNPALNRFDLSYTNTFSAKIGLLYPIQCDEVYPGDVFKMKAFCHAQVQPMVAPLMSDLTIFAHTFFVPYRILYGVDSSDGQSIWEKFITGGKDGDYDTALPGWSPSFSVVGFSSGTIWDFIGNPVSYDASTGKWTPVVPEGISVSVAPRLAYNKIYNDWYRDENLINEVSDSNEYLLKASFKKDYFTSALEEQQRGISPAIPIEGDIPVTISGNGNVLISGSPNIYFDGSSSWISTPINNNSTYLRLSGPTANYFRLETSSNGVDVYGNVNASVSSTVGSLAGTFDGSQLSGLASSVSLSAVNINQLRLMFAQQRLLELNMRAGYRYTEFISAHFGCSPTDARLDRPEYIGGCLVPINVGVGVQSSETSATSPQGNKIGIASADAVQPIGNYRVLEHGVIMTLVSVRPKPVYQQGINRQWLRQTRWDYYFPEFAYLSEQGIYNAELFVSEDSDVDPDIFGYQAHWNEMRCKNNIVSGAVREQFDYWTLARKFANKPSLNRSFIEIDDSEFNRVFAVQDEDEFIISWSSLIDAFRPIPAMGVPGLVDHVYGG